MLHESLQDAGEIIHNVLHQPLALSQTAQDISLLQAALLFDQNGFASKELSEVLQAFISYPDSTHNLLTEMKLIVSDLEENRD